MGPTFPCSRTFLCPVAYTNCFIYFSLDLKKETHDDDDEDEPQASQPSADPSTPESIIKHQLYLLRFKLMHFVNSIHNYLMTRVGVFIT